VQPNYGLDEVFGARESYVEFTPDISNDLMLEVKGSKIYGRYFRQDYELHGGEAAGHYANGTIAAVEHKFGQGRTLLIGSFPGGGYFLHHASPTKDLFASLLTIAGVAPQVTIDDKSVQARLHQGAGGTYLWVTNPTRSVRQVKVSIAPAAGNYKSGEDIWGKQSVAVDGAQVTVSVGGRDAAVIALL
jgi:beta-galactosidase